MRRVLFLPALFLVLTAPLAALAAPEPMPTSIPGTYWSLLSLTAKGEKPVDAQNPADVELTKKGGWGILHYGGHREAGSYTIKGDRMIWKSEDGSIYGDFKIVWKKNERILELHTNTDIMRLRFLKTINY